MIPKYEQPQVAVADTFKYDTVDDGIRAAELGWQDYFADPRLHRLIDIRVGTQYRFAHRCAECRNLPQAAHDCAQQPAADR